MLLPIFDPQAVSFMNSGGAPGGLLLRVLLAVRGLRLIRLTLFMQAIHRLAAANLWPLQLVVLLQRHWFDCFDSFTSLPLSLAQATFLLCDSGNWWWFWATGATSPS